MNKREFNYRICYSSARGLEFTGVQFETEAEAKEYCEKENKENPSPYIQTVYTKA